MSIDYEGIARRAFDERLDAADQASLLVWGDLLQARGDPRGGLIALEHARLPKAIVAHVLDNGPALVGDAALELLAIPRCLGFSWRAGGLFSLAVDTRRASRLLKLDPVEIVERVLAMPCATGLRRLQLRIRRATNTDTVNDAVIAGPLRAIEQLVITDGLAPHAVVARPSAHLPTMWAHALDAWIPLPTEGEVDVRDLPETLEGRKKIGRALFDPARRGGALARIRTLGPRAWVFVDVLVALAELLLADGVTIIETIAALGDAGRSAWPTLAVITGRPDNYDLPLRRAAGIALDSVGEYRRGR